MNVVVDIVYKFDRPTYYTQVRRNEMKKNPLSFQLDLNPDDFLPASEEEKQSQVIMRESVSFWKDGFRRLRKNKVAMVSIVVIILVMIFSFIVPSFYPYTYDEQIKGANNLAPFTYSADEQARIDAGDLYSHMSSVQIRWDVTTPSVL